MIKTIAWFNFGPVQPSASPNVVVFVVWLVALWAGLAMLHVYGRKLGRAQKN